MKNCKKKILCGFLAGAVLFASGCGNKDTHPGDSDLKSDLTADCRTCRNESDPFRCHDDRKSCGWICHTSGRRQPVCGKFTYQCADDADRKEGNADDWIFHACTASDHIYSGDQSLSALIRRAKT